MEENFPKTFLSCILLAVAGVYAALCIVESRTFLSPVGLLTALLGYCLVIAPLLWKGRIWRWASIPAFLGVGLVLLLVLAFVHLKLTGPPY